MFESESATTQDLEVLLSALSRLGDADDDSERVTQLDLLERLKAVCAAVQARVTVDLAESQAQIAEQWREYARAAADVGDFDAWRSARERARAASCPEADASSDPTPFQSEHRRRRGKPRVDIGMAAQVALARRESPHAGSRLVRLAFAVTHEMPYLLALMESGLLSERRASLVVQECAALSLEQRVLVDAELGQTVGVELGRLSERELSSRVRAITYRLDARTVVDRAAYAESERRVTLRPAPDAMCWLTALLPAAQGVGVLAAMSRAADSAKASGDPRGKGQIMADTLVERVTGLATAEAVPVELQLVMTERALLSGDETPGCLQGYGSVPAEWARRLLSQTYGDAPGLPERAQVWVRRLYTHPVDGTLVAMDSRRRVFDGELRRFLLARDGGICRTPGCGAPIRHLDHVVPHTKGGRTSAVNGQGLCVRCNLVKELAGWHVCVLQPTGPPGTGLHTVEITTPTGQHYRGSAPPLVHEDPESVVSPLERAIAASLAA